MRPFKAHHVGSGVGGSWHDSHVSLLENTVQLRLGACRWVEIFAWTADLVLNLPHGTADRGRAGRHGLVCRHGH